MKTGIVGCGVAAKYHIAAISKIKDVEIVGVCDINEETAKTMAERFKIGSFFTDLSKMIKQAKPDVVHILTPPRSHASLSLLALNSGCHVLVEKPMAISINEADELIAAAKKNDVKLCVVHNHIFDPIMQRVKSLLQKELLGNIFHVKVNYCYHTKKMMEEGHINHDHWVHSLPINFFGEYAPHQIYLLLHLLENLTVINVSKRQLYSTTDRPIDELNVLFDAENATASLSIFTNTAYGHFTIDIYGVKAILHIDMLNLTMTIQKERNLPRIPARMLAVAEQSCQNLYNISLNIVKILLGRLKTRMGHRILIRKFYESIHNNITPPITGEQGKEVIRILEMIEKNVTIG